MLTEPRYGSEEREESMQRFAALRDQLIQEQVGGEGPLQYVYTNGYVLPTAESVGRPIKGGLLNNDAVMWWEAWLQGHPLRRSN